MAKQRVSISPAVLKDALAIAAASTGTAAHQDWNDTDLTYLTLRQRGRTVTWLVRAYNVTRKIGVATGQFKDPEYLGVREARDRAREAYVKIAAEKGTRPLPGTEWTWADLAREYQQSLTEVRESGNRTKTPSRGTQDDVRLMLAKPPIQKLSKLKLRKIEYAHVANAIDAVHAAHGHRVACKTLTYVKAALTWALAKRGLKSGLHGTMPWWTTLMPPDRTGEEIVKRKENRKRLATAKVEFTISHLAQLLIIHDKYCIENRTKSEKIGPGVRLGLWFLCFTGGRRGSTAAFERKGLLHDDGFGRPGWGQARWPEEDMKGKEFWLPLPPAVLAIANASMDDRDQLIRNAKGAQSDLPTRWVFASTRSPERDLATYPTSLNAHIRSMRGEKKSGRNSDDAEVGRKAKNWLADLPYFSPHLVRSVAGNYLDGLSHVPKPAISAMLAHTDGNEDDRLSPVTRAFYVQNQRMDLKAIAMEAWSSALTGEIVKQGGQLPIAVEGLRPSKVKQAA
jgi:integrase